MKCSVVCKRLSEEKRKASWYCHLAQAEQRAIVVV